MNWLLLGLIGFKNNKPFLKLYCSLNILNSYHFETTRIQEILLIYEHNRDAAPKNLCAEFS